MRILYINYVDSDHLTSGSSVRPIRILNAFKESGHEIITLTGDQMKRSRIANVRKVERMVSENRPDICYIESPVHPIYRQCDRRLIRDLNRLGVPIGFFLRDFYAKFRKDFPRRKNSVLNYIKDCYWDYLLHKTYKTLAYCDIVYLPSNECKCLFQYKDMRSLPPAGENVIIRPRKANHTCLYIGGIMGHYNCDLLLDTFDYLHKIDHSFHLILVTREKVWKRYQHPLKNAEWLEVHHTSGDGLIPLYERASLGLVVPRTDIQYNHFAVSVKVFEYMSYGLPVIATNSKALAEIINNESVGYTAESTVEGLALKIQQLLNNPDEYYRICNNIYESLMTRHLWKHRVDQIISELTEKLQKK